VRIEAYKVTFCNLGESLLEQLAGEAHIGLVCVFP
jgi:hypothetical protein